MGVGDPSAPPLPTSRESTSQSLLTHAPGSDSSASFFSFRNRFFFSARSLQPFAPWLAGTPVRELETRLARFLIRGQHSPTRNSSFSAAVNFTAEFPAFYGNDTAVEDAEKKKLPGPRKSIPLRWCLTVSPSTKEAESPRLGTLDGRAIAGGLTAASARIAHSLGMKVLLKPQLLDAGRQSRGH